MPICFMGKVKSYFLCGLYWSVRNIRSSLMDSEWIFDQLSLARIDSCRKTRRRCNQGFIWQSDICRLCFGRNEAGTPGHIPFFQIRIDWWSTVGTSNVALRSPSNNSSDLLKFSEIDRFTILQRTGDKCRNA